MIGGVWIVQTRKVSEINHVNQQMSWSYHGKWLKPVSVETMILWTKLVSNTILWTPLLFSITHIYVTLFKSRNNRHLERLTTKVIMYLQYNCIEYSPPKIGWQKISSERLVYTLRLSYYQLLPRPLLYGTMVMYHREHPSLSY